MSEETEATVIEPGENPNQLNIPKMNMKKAGLSLNPFSPVPFSGTDGFFAAGRILLYGGLAYFTYTKMKPLSLTFGIAAGTSLLTSISASAWNGVNAKEV